MFTKISHAILAIFILCSVSPVFSQGRAALGTKEIQSSKKIQFQNRSIRKAPPEVIQENTGMGKSLADAIRKDSTKPATVEGLKIVRVLPGEDSKFGADILSLDSNQSFDHINSIVRIVAAYIESAYQYPETDSETLALYVLYYNASHRQDINFFQKRYTSKLSDNINKDKVGIDTSYRNWPGKTQLVIPIVGNILKDSKQDLTTDELEDDVNKTVQNKEKDEDTKAKMLAEKEKMDKLQNDKIKAEQQLVQQKKEEAAKKQQELDKQLQANKQKETQAVGVLQELNKDPVKNKTQIEQKKEEIKKIQEETKKVEEEKKQVTQTKEELDKKEEELAKKEEARKENSSSSTSTSSTDSTKQDPAKTTTEETKPATVEEVKKELAQVKEELKKKEEKSENVIGNKIMFMKFIKYDSDGHYSNELWAIDPVKDDTLFKSPYNNICSKEFIDVPNQGILVLGYEGAKVDDRKHRLVLLDTESLKVKKQSDEADVFWRTPMVFTDNKIYVIDKFEGNFHLSRFNPDLTLDKRSSAPVEENSEITFFKDKIYITGKGKGEGKTTIKVFKRDDLSLTKTLSP
ncbi:P83/100 family protein [Leptospira sp. GIMC2001]|uniref:P83/100 family protein n=1 Tax=Leptospira sp. GIMC2001 TaxID=1513297 RepID=UPI00234A95CB|nr:P83/100 family protein [Leptospira sp. GIMC2001]WCL48436.1 P83/100 family protein [Leptospira sp. GIMC2001]